MNTYLSSIKFALTDMQGGGQNIKNISQLNKIQYSSWNEQ